MAQPPQVNVSTPRSCSVSNPTEGGEEVMEGQGVLSERPLSLATHGPGSPVRAPPRAGLPSLD